MTALSGYGAALPTDVLLGTLVLYIDSATAYGATQGEPTVNIPREFVNLPFDGSLGIPMVGLHRKMWSDIFIEGRFIELNTTKALDLEPAGTTGTSGGITTITPGAYGEFLVAGDYKQNVRGVMRRGGGGIVAIEFDWALLRMNSLVGDSLGNGVLDIRLDACHAAGSAPGVPPYSIKLAADLATIVAADP